MSKFFSLRFLKQKQPTFPL